MNILSGIIFLAFAVCVILAIGRTWITTTGPKFDPTWIEYKACYDKRQAEGWK